MADDTFLHSLTVYSFGKVGHLKFVSLTLLQKLNSD
jgi:hypothetical protein